jgi:hypothetical protein
MTSRVIPPEAVEVVARAMYASLYADPFDKQVGEGRQEFLAMAHAAIESAAPHMFQRELAVAWAAGARAGWKQSGEGWNAEYPDEGTGVCHVDLSDNPYRPSGNA